MFVFIFVILLLIVCLVSLREVYFSTIICFVSDKGSALVPQALKSLTKLFKASPTVQLRLIYTLTFLTAGKRRLFTIPVNVPVNTATIIRNGR